MPLRRLVLATLAAAACGAPVEEADPLEESGEIDSSLAAVACPAAGDPTFGACSGTGTIRLGSNRAGAGGGSSLELYQTFRVARAGTRARVRLVAKRLRRLPANAGFQVHVALRVASSATVVPSSPSANLASVAVTGFLVGTAASNLTFDFASAGVVVDPALTYALVLTVDPPSSPGASTLIAFGTHEHSSYPSGRLLRHKQRGATSSTLPAQASDDLSFSVELAPEAVPLPNGFTWEQTVSVPANNYWDLEYLNGSLYSNGLDGPIHQIVRLDPATGAVQGSFAAPTSAAVALASNGTDLFVGSATLFTRVDSTSGAVLGTLNTFIPGGGGAATIMGGTLYHAGVYSGLIGFYGINTVTGGAQGFHPVGVSTRRLLADVAGEVLWGTDLNAAGQPCLPGDPGCQFRVRPYLDGEQQADLAVLNYATLAAYGLSSTPDLTGIASDGTHLWAIDRSGGKLLQFLIND